MQVRVVKSRDDQPLASIEGASAVAAMTAGYRLVDGKQVKNFEDYIEDAADGTMIRETVWVFDDAHVAEIAGERLPLEAFFIKFRDLDWCKANSEHPIAYLRHAHENLSKFRDHFRKHRPMILLRKGQRTLKIRPDLTPDEKAKWLKLL
jgi:hypothetical protein